MSGCVSSTEHMRGGEAATFPTQFPGGYRTNGYHASVLRRATTRPPREQLAPDLLMWRDVFCAAALFYYPSSNLQRVFHESLLGIMESILQPTWSTVVQTKAEDYGGALYF